MNRDDLEWAGMPMNLAMELSLALNELRDPNLSCSAKDGTLAADLHAFYNVVGLEEGWLLPEYATPLSEQPEVTQVKNVDAALDVVNYWITQMGGDDMNNNVVAHLLNSELGGTNNNQYSNLVQNMMACVDYESNRGNSHLEAAADSQHEQWVRFVDEHQKERVTPGHEKFREKNYKQFLAKYSELSENEKDQDRLAVAVLTDRILANADIGYKSKIQLK